MNVRNLLKYFYRYVPIDFRYGKSFRDTYKLLGKTEYADLLDLQALQFRNLKKLLIYSFKNVPYYRRVFKECHFDPNKMNNIDEIKEIPYLTKKIVTENAQDLLSECFPKSQIEYAKTGGTTGVPMGFYREKKRSIAIERAFVLKAFEWAGYFKNARTAVLRGDTPVGNPDKRNRKIWSFDPLRNRAIFSSYDINDKNIHFYIAALKKFKPLFIHAYPSSLHLLTNYLRGYCEEIRSVKAVITSSETLYEFQRKNIESFFNTKIYDLYGNREQTCFAAQCEVCDGYHVFPEYGFTEIISQDGRDVTNDGESGEIVSTSFYNYAMPFIRYKTGDIVTHDAIDCKCGRKYQKIKDIYGRAQDYFVTFDGSLVPLTGGTDQLILSRIDGILQSQYVQKKHGEVTLNIVTKGIISEADNKNIISELSSRYGDNLKFEIRCVERIQTTKRGKHRMLIQKLPIHLHKNVY